MKNCPLNIPERLMTEDEAYKLEAEETMSIRYKHWYAIKEVAALYGIPWHRVAIAILKLVEANEVKE